MRKSLIYIIAIVAGLGVAAVSFFFLKTQAVGEETKYLVLVPTRNIEMYESISGTDITLKEFPEYIQMPNMASSPEQVIGKAANTVLYAGWPIDTRNFSEPQEMDTKHFVTIYTNYPRTGGAKPGDMVDVYLAKKVDTSITLPYNSASVSDSKGIPVAQDARVISISDNKGKTQSEDTPGGLRLPGGESSSAFNLEVVRLAVKPKEAPFLVSGSLEDSDNYVLVVKNKESTNGKELKNFAQEPTEQDISEEGSEAGTD